MKSQFFLPVATCFINCSVSLLSIGTRPSPRNTLKAFHWFVQVTQRLAQRAPGQYLPRRVTVQPRAQAAHDRFTGTKRGRRC
jgi:hypothetical protein